MVKNWITTNGTVFGAYLETHIQPSNSRRISSAIPRGWIFFANWEHHRTGRIVVVWRPNVLATIYKGNDSDCHLWFLYAPGKYQSNGDLCIWI